MIRLPFQGFFNKVASVFKKQKPVVPPIRSAKQGLPQEVKRPGALATWLGIAKENARNITPHGKALMLQLAEEKRERRRQRNLRLIGRTQ